MKIALISHLKFPISMPFNGGLEAYVYKFVTQMRDRGHEVTLYAAGDSDPALNVHPIIPQASVPAASNIPIPVDERVNWIREQEEKAFRKSFELIEAADFDLVYNNSLSPLVIEYISRTDLPAVTTMHCPPLSKMKEAVQYFGPSDSCSYINISEANAKSWEPYAGTHDVIYNGIDTSVFSPEPIHHNHPRRLIWFGRIHPDKGLPLAIEAAHMAGIPLDIAGPVSDQNYFDYLVKPTLAPEDRYLGHLNSDELKRAIAKSAVALVTPLWEEPFGLVVVEALACGTPVAGFRRGALPEIITPEVGRIAEADNIADLADKIQECLHLKRQDCADRVEQHFSLDRMLDDYENLFARMIDKTTCHSDHPFDVAPPTAKGDSTTLLEMEEAE